MSDAFWDNLPNLLTAIGGLIASVVAVVLSVLASRRSKRTQRAQENLEEQVRTGSFTVKQDDSR